ncbi:hypothetical protein J6E39_05305 [bacterium]|nr:hypothetical protein [bacterium]
MKKVMVGILIFGLVLNTAGVMAYEAVDLGAVDTPKIQIPKTEVKTKESLVVSDEAIISQLVEMQKQKDMEDIENLWKGTVANDQVIAFALKKLSTPESQRRIHSSLMAKTLSAIVAGSSFVPYAIGSDYMLQTASFAAGRLAQNLINKKNIPQEIPLTDTELIELAGLVENLQDRIINAYYNYKGALTQLKQTRSKLILYNKNYAKALEDEDILEITISSAMYDNMLIDEYYYFQTAEKYHLELQRLAGKKVVDSLNLFQSDYTLVNEKAVSK